MNSRRPSKPNLPSAPKPSKLLVPTGLHQTLSSLAYRIPQSPIGSTKMNCLKKLLLFYFAVIHLVRLNLFNHVLALFRVKFACNLVIRYTIFRWEFCKGSVWESVKKSSRVCNQEKPCDWISRLASRQNGTRVKHAGGVEGSRQLLHYKTKPPV